MSKYALDEIKKISVPIAKKYGVKKLVLFGDCEHSEQINKSDIYFLIDEDKVKGWEYFGFIENLEDNLGVKVDVLIDKSMRHSLFAPSLKNGVVLYEE